MYPVHQPVDKKHPFRFCLAVFFRGEDGIRAFHVTGVQTCALPISGYLDVTEVKVNGRKAATHIDGTVMRVNLPKPLQPGQSARIEMKYRLKLPRGGSRLNAFGRTAFLAQWYPMLAVKDEDGWHKIGRAHV